MVDIFCMKKIEESPFDIFSINLFLIDSLTSLHSSREVPVTRYPTKEEVTKTKFTPAWLYTSGKGMRSGYSRG